MGVTARYGGTSYAASSPASEEELGCAAVAEVPHTGMFQKGIHDACHADVVAVLLPGDEAADAADNEVYLYTGLRGS